MNKSDFISMIREVLSEQDPVADATSAKSPALIAAEKEKEDAQKNEKNEQDKLAKLNAKLTQYTAPYNIKIDKQKQKLGQTTKKAQDASEKATELAAREQSTSTTTVTAESFRSIVKEVFDEVVGDGTLLPEGSFEDYNWFEKGNWIGIWSTKWTTEAVADIARWLQAEKISVHNKTYRGVPILLINKNDKNKLITFLKNTHDKDLIDIGQSIESLKQVKTPLMELLEQMDQYKMGHANTFLPKDTEFKKFHDSGMMVGQELKRLESEISKLSQNEMSGDEDIGAMSMQAAERILSKSGITKDDQEFEDKATKLSDLLQSGIKVSKVYKVTTQPSSVVDILMEN